MGKAGPKSWGVARKQPHGKRELFQRGRGQMGGRPLAVGCAVSKGIGVNLL